MATLPAAVTVATASAAERRRIQTTIATDLKLSAKRTSATAYRYGNSLHIRMTATPYYFMSKKLQNNNSTNTVISHLVRSPVSTHRGRNSRPSERIINSVFFRAGPKDCIRLRRQSGAQLSFSTHFSHCSALQLHLVAQQLSQRRRRVTTPTSVLTCFLPSEALLPKVEKIKI